MTLSTPSTRKQFRRDSGFVGVAELGSTKSLDIDQPSNRLDIDQKPEIDNTDDNVVVAYRRQSRMFSIDFDFLESDGEPDRIVNKYKQMGISFAADLALFAYGSCFTMSSIVLPQIEKATNNNELTITSEEGSWFASVFVFGSITGALVGGITGEKLGRKCALMIDNVIMIVGLLLIALPHSFPFMLVGRYLCGHACSSIQVVAPSYTSEISQPLIRPLTSNIFIVTFICGGTIMFVIGALVPWHIAVIVTLIWPILSFICIMTFCPESPVWLLNKGKDELAEKSLMILRGDEKIVQNELKLLKSALKEMEMYNNDSGEQASGVQEVLELLKDKAFLKPFGILLVLYVFTVNWGGSPSLSFYMIILLQKSNFHYDSYAMGASLSVFRSIIIILSTGFTSKMRRRPLFLICGVFHLIGMATIGIYNFLNEDGRLEKAFSLAQWIPIIAILLIYSFSTVGYVSMVFMLTPEMLPSHARAIGCGLVGFFDNISLSLSVKMIPTMLDNIDVSGTFTVYAILTVVALVFSYFFLPETYGLSLNEIERMFRGSQKSDASTLELQHAEIRKSSSNSLNRLRSNSVLSLYDKGSHYIR